MVSGSVTVNNEFGLHLRPASYLCKLAMEYSSKVSMRRNETTVNAKSVLGVLAACVKYGDEVEFICEGEDEEQALSAILSAASCGFGEDMPQS